MVSDNFILLQKPTRYFADKDRLEFFSIKNNQILGLKLAGTTCQESEVPG